MPKHFNQIHGRDKPRHLQNERKQEINRYPKYVPSPVCHDSKPIELNVMGLILLYMATNAELLKFGTTFQANPPQFYGNNQQCIFKNTNNVFKNTGTSVEFNQEESIRIPSFSKK